MQICPCGNAQYLSPVFTHYSKKGTSAKNNDYYTTTEFFRDDFDVDGLIHYAKNIYKNTSKVNIVSYGCSDGEETYSLALRLKTILGCKSNKFFPIIAMDIDSECINRARRGRFKINDYECQKLEYAGGLNLDRYINIYDDGLEKYAFIKDSLKQNMAFSKADIMDDIDKIPDKNTILICRNFWGYLGGNDQIKLADKISEKMDDTSLVVIGKFDKAYNVDKILEKRGFKETEIEGVYRKISK